MSFRKRELSQICVHTQRAIDLRTGRKKFRRARFQTPCSESFFAITEFRGEKSSQPCVCVSKRPHRVCDVVERSRVCSKNSVSSMLWKQGHLQSRETQGHALWRLPHRRDRSRIHRTIGAGLQIAEIEVLRCISLGRHACRTHTAPRKMFNSELPSPRRFAKRSFLNIRIVPMENYETLSGTQSTREIGRVNKITNISQMSLLSLILSSWLAQY